MKKFLIAMLLLVSGLASAAALVEGENADYTRLAAPQPVANPKHVEVIEFFSYSCIHCYKLDPYIMSWAKSKPADVDFKRVQIVWGQPMEGLARFFATMNELKLVGKLNHAAFVAVMDQHINLGNPAELAPWLRTQKGVDANHFMNTFNSFGINTQLANAKQLTQAYAIQGTPSIVVNGKYEMVPADPQIMIRRLNQMIDMARKEKK
jgi:thiol:disulfide interchange protein DsbA